jgi:16S rRNA (cytosine1402-N4)-methyltransferase
MKHISVLLNESIDGLAIKKGDIVVDGTLGGGGHTLEILRRFNKQIKMICFDLDEDAIVRVKKILPPETSNVIFQNTGFQELKKVTKELKVEKVNRILLDLGISSFQLEEAGRGFSFQRDEPLLMTMKKNPKGDDITAHEIVNFWEEQTLADIIFGFGEERFARRIAKAITENRAKSEIKTTFDLVRIIEEAVGRSYRGKKIHPATRTFQALRIATNSELPNLEKIVKEGFECLEAGGRMAIITFHSLEDRIVKKAFVDLKNKSLAKMINKKPILPSLEEIKENPRSRSAKLRLLEKI